MTNAKVYQGFLDDKKVEVHWPRPSATSFRTPCRLAISTTRRHCCRTYPSNTFCRYKRLFGAATVFLFKMQLVKVVAHFLNRFRSFVNY